MRRIGKWILIVLGAIFLIGIVVTIVSPDGRRGIERGITDTVQTPTPSPSPTPSPTASPTPLPTPDAAAGEEAFWSFFDTSLQSTADDSVCVYFLMDPDGFLDTFMDGIEEGAGDMGEAADIWARYYDRAQARLHVLSIYSEIC